MAKGRNLILDGFSGKLGNSLVIRQRGDITVLSEAPGKREGEPSEAQKAHQARFQQAIVYARRQISDAESKAEYEAKADDLHSAFNVSVADFMRAPDIDEIDISGYSGATGDTIRVKAIDDFKVEMVHVKIENADGTLVEEGDAALSDDGLNWIYTATADNTETEGDKITISVSDKPGNVTEQEETL